MSELVVSASLLASFIAGIAALFAPCCISVLLPAYLGSVFRQRRTVLLMTFVFFLGLLLVFLPLGLGMAGLGTALSGFHDLIFTIGGLLLLGLGLFILLGRHFSLPMPFQSRGPIRGGSGHVKGAASVFSLGVFSGLATLCCAPVLAGVLALAVLPGSLFWGGVYALFYVLGMVAPLFFLAALLDRTNATGKLHFFKRRFSYGPRGAVTLTVADLLSGATFLAMGALILSLAITGNLAMAPSASHTNINIAAAQLTSALAGLPIPALLLPAIAFIAIAALLFVFIRAHRSGEA